MEEEEGQEEAENGKERGGTYVPLTVVEVEVGVEVAVWKVQGVSGDAAVCPLDGGECSWDGGECSWDGIAEKNGVLGI